MKLSNIAAALISLTKLRCALVALAAVLPAAPSHAQNFAFVSASGSGTACTATAPCSSVLTALSYTAQPVQVLCLNGAAEVNEGLLFSQSGLVVDIDCPQGFVANLQFYSANATVRMRHLGFGKGSFSNLLIFNGSGTLILEDCVFTDATGIALDIEPSGPLNLVIRNSRISNGGTVAMVLKPAAGGSINATFDHVTVTENGGGGIRLDTTNGPVTADVTDSVITNNTGNGLSAQGGAGGAAMLSIHNSVIAKNGAAGVSATGTNGAAMVDMTLLDSNASGATSVISGAHILSYGNNRIVGMPGSGFTSTTPLQ
jgi:hypothetical protein